MAKFCVFCGDPPTNKNKEHVVPKWLMKLTGDPKRNINVGFKKNFDKGFENRVFSLDQLTFPACAACNTKYSSLEEKVKTIIERLLAEDELTGNQISILLDWLDKVRVGLWLGLSQLDKNYANIEPNFHIDKRIGQFDRLLLVEKSDSTRRRLNFGGVDTLSFALTPSAFLLIINNFYLTNISYMFFLARRLGFPYPSAISIVPDNARVKCEFTRGLGRLMKPILRRPISEKGLFFYQTMYAGGLFDDEPTNLYQSNDYVRAHSMDHAAGIGSIFVEEGVRLTELRGEDKIKIQPQPYHNDEEKFIRSAINILEWQNWIDDQLPSRDELAADQRKYINARQGIARKMNRIFIDQHKKLLRSGRK